MNTLDENAVILAVQQLLSRQGFAMVPVPAGKRGVDLSGSRQSDQSQWFIEAKGATSSQEGSAGFGKDYGSGSAFDRVAKALLTACDYRRLHPGETDHVGIAIPATEWFDEHSMKIEDACRQQRITIFRVHPDGNVVLAGYAPHTGS